MRSAKWMMVGAALVVLAACSPPSTLGGSDASVGFVLEDPSARRAAAESAPAEGVQAPGQLVGAPLLAYAYSVGLEASTQALPGLLAGHQAACKAAGMARCQVINASTNAEGVDQISGRLEMRAEPRWLESFRTGLADDAKSAGGRITSSSTTSEDLTRQIIDVSARLAAQRALRDRLQRLLENRPGKLSELLDVERELARVQGELDSLTSTLAVMQARVATSLLTLDYSSRPSPVSSDTWAPLHNALTGFFGTVVSGFAILLRAIAVLLPFAIVLGPLGWFGLRALRRRRIALKPAAASDQTRSA